MQEKAAPFPLRAFEFKKVTIALAWVFFTADTRVIFFGSISTRSLPTMTRVLWP